LEITKSSLWISRLDGSSEGMSNNRRLLLVVEDDADVAGTLSEFLEDEGFSVTVAQNGKQALEQLRAGLRPSAILLDLLMPEMNGWQFRMEQISDPNLRGIGTIILTAAAPPAEWMAVMAGAEVIQKPIDIDKLRSTIDRLSTITA
jgi:two-component system response regulator MprA